MTFAINRPPLVLSVHQSNNGLPGRLFAGKVGFKLEFTNPNAPHGASTAATQSQTFAFSSTGIEDSFSVSVSDFRLHPSLLGAGVGTLVWSSLYRALPPNVSERAILRGTLRSEDSTALVVDEAGRILYEEESRSLTRSPLRRSNIGIRNAFWKRMLSDTEHCFECDAEGTGYFRGRWVDPAIRPDWMPGYVLTRI